MKTNVALLHTLFILALTGLTLGDHQTDQDCSHAADSESKSLHDIVLESLSKCFGKVENLDFQTLKDSDNDAEVFFTFFKTFCTKQDVITNCLSTRSVQSLMCLNKTEDVALGFVEDILKTALSYGCFERGQHLAHFIFTMYHLENSTSERNAFTDCVTTAKSTGIESNMDASTRLLGFYREFKVFKRCLVNRFRGSNRLVYYAEVQLNGMLRSMKCLNPADGATRLCETLDTTPLTEETFCPYVGRNKQAPTNEMFFEFAGECALVKLDQLDVDSMKTFTTIEDFRTFFKVFCENRPPILNCLGDVTSNSKVCQSETDHQVFGTFKYFMEYSLATGCKQDGSDIATIFNGIFNRHELAVGIGPVRACIDGAGSALKLELSPSDSDSLPSLILKVYRVTHSLKQCILDKASEVSSFKSVFSKFIEDILGAAKCVNPDEGITGLCRTMINI